MLMIRTTISRVEYASLPDRTCWSLVCVLYSSQYVFFVGQCVCTSLCSPMTDFQGMDVSERSQQLEHDDAHVNDRRVSFPVVQAPNDAEFQRHRGQRDVDLFG